MAETVCPNCGGSGWKIVEKEDVSAAERCECVFGERTKRIEEKANIPPLYHNASFANFAFPQDNPVAERELKSAMLMVRSFTENFPMAGRPGLLLVGDWGTGKTHLAVAALRILIAKGFE